MHTMAFTIYDNYFWQQVVAKNLSVHMHTEISQFIDATNAKGKTTFLRFFTRTPV